MNQAFNNYHDKLRPLFQYMKGLTARPSLKDVIDRLNAFEVTVEELGQHVSFHANRYRRNLMFENKYVQLLCLCWKSGQRSPIHDHADSICGVKVIQGVASETVFERTLDGLVKPRETVDYGKGVVGSQDDDIHQLANLQGIDRDLVTLHVYSPPLKGMRTFSLDSKTIKPYEPISEVHQGGSGI